MPGINELDMKKGDKDFQTMLKRRQAQAGAYSGLSGLILVQLPPFQSHKPAAPKSTRISS